MKRKNAIGLCFFFLLFLAKGHAQVVNIEKSVLKTILFDDFVNGSVLMKNGSTETASLNYDTENQSILFKKDDQVMTLTGLESVDTVYIQDRKFVPIDNTFYEVAVGGDVAIALFVTYTNKKKPVAASPEHAGTTRQTGNKVNNNVANAYVSRPNQLNFAVEFIKHYWLKRGNSMYKANNEGQVIKAFPLKDNTTIKDYLKTNAVDFQKVAEVARLVKYCNSLMN